ncbi:MAG: SagB/ThcOx family dehydrogenase [Planctomycetota bacterium]
MDDLQKYRYFMKDSIRKEIDFSATDQNRGVKPPPWQKPADPDAVRVTLPRRGEWEKKIGPLDLVTAVDGRESRRMYSKEPFPLEELAFLLWITQGLRGHRGDRAILRTVPSAGARHSFETYLFARNVEGLDEGVYRFLADDEALVLEHRVTDMQARLTAACLGQVFVGKAPVTFVWASLPYRMEWRYSLSAHRAVLLDAGHVAQNLYLGCEAIHAGTCAVGAYDQEGLDSLVGLDGKDEFVVYLAPVGKRK